MTTAPPHRLLVLLAVVLLLALVVLIATLGGGTVSYRRPLQQLQPWTSLNLAGGCEPASGGLAAQNWTDGDPAVPLAGVCAWRPQLSAAHVPGLASHLGIPKVAMLFLSVGPLRHEALWGLWFRSAAQLLPADCAAAARCGAPAASREPQLAGLLADFVGHHPGPIQSQALFSVHVHLPPSEPLFPPESVFAGTEIAHRVNSSWGTFDLAQVARNLMGAALQDPLNMRFMTVSEACIPLYPPHVVYQQLLYAPKSRVNACTTRGNWGRDEYRWTWRLEEATDGRLTKAMWRKSHQWLALTRKHARLTVADAEVAAAFGKHCYSGSDPDCGGWWRSCFSDEHYFSTLLAFHGLDKETDCMGELTHTLWCSWCQGDERLHPHTYTRGETSMQKLRELREEAGGCDAARAHASAARLLPSVLDAAAWSAGAWRGREAYLLPPKCPLFARKFTDEAVPAAMHALLGLTSLEQAQHSLAQRPPPAAAAERPGAAVSLPDAAASLPAAALEAAGASEGRAGDASLPDPAEADTGAAPGRGPGAAQEGGRQRRRRQVLPRRQRQRTDAQSQL